jgi:hypothetical protein
MTATGGGSVIVENPSHRVWTAQDQAILYAIQSTLTQGVTRLVHFAATSPEAWSILESSFSVKSSARSMAIQNKLGELKKLDMSAEKFFNKAKTLAGTLAAIDQPLQDSEFLGYVLNGLDEDYGGLVEAVNGREHPIPPQELLNRLLATERRVEARRAACSYTDSSANAAHRSGVPPFETNARCKQKGRLKSLLHKVLCSFPNTRTI